MFIKRGIINHLDFITRVIDSKYIFENIIQEDKTISVEKFSLMPKNQYADFIWPASVTVTRNDNYVFSIHGVTKQKDVEFNPPVFINCKTERWKIIFDNYDPTGNTVIYLFGTVEEPLGLNINM